MKAAWGRRGADLVEVLGEDCVTALVRAFAGRLIRVPSVAGLERLRRRRRIHDELDGGASYREVARAVGVAPSTVTRHAKRFTGNT